MDDPKTCMVDETDVIESGVGILCAVLGEVKWFRKTHVELGLRLE